MAKTRTRKSPSQAAIEGRWSAKYIKARDRYRAKCEAHGVPCHLCGQGIDYTLPAGDPGSFEVDHFYPVATHPHLMEDPANFRPSHKDCNASRGARDVRPTLGHPSREW